MEPDFDKLPEQYRDGMRRYFERGVMPGSFLRSVLANDLVNACGRADEIGRVNLFEIVTWCYWELPSNAWQSLDAVDAWSRARYAETEAAR